VELVAVTGSSAAIAQTLRAEVGTDRSRFPTGTHCCSWLGLAPHHDLSGGRVWRSRPLQGVHRAPPAGRQAAPSVARAPSACGASVRSMRGRLGPEQAPVATARKIARVVDHLLPHREAFQGKSAMEYERERREREVKHRSRRAKQLGYTLSPAATSQPAAASDASRLWEVSQEPLVRLGVQPPLLGSSWGAYVKGSYL
jgi:transposase